MCMPLQADRDGRAQEFASKFQDSYLYKKHEVEVEHQFNRPAQLSRQMQKELRVKRDTSTSVPWGWWIILKVGAVSASNGMQCR